MRRGIATQTNRFELYDSESGTRLRGIVTVQLPAFELASNEYSGAGVGGKLNVPAPSVMNAVTCSLAIPQMYGEIIDYLKLGTTRTLDLRSEIVVADSETQAAVKVPERWVIRGPVSKGDPGKVEQAAAGDAGIDVQVWYAAHWIDGESVLEWDPLNNIHTVHGEDLMAETRRNLGL